MKSRTLTSLLGATLCCGLILAASGCVLADQQAQALLAKVQAATQAAKTLTADYRYSSETPVPGKATETGVRFDGGTVVLMKPNYADISWDPGVPVEQHMVSDGKYIYTYYKKANCYTKVAADPQGRNIAEWHLITVGGFLNLAAWLKDGLFVRNPSEFTYAGKAPVDGVTYQVIEHKAMGQFAGKSCPVDQKIYIGSDNLIHQFTEVYMLAGRPGQVSGGLTKMKTGTSLTPQRFTFKIPAKARLVAHAPANP